MITSQGKINKEKIDVIVNHIRTGNYISTACRAVGIHDNTYTNWINKAESLLDKPASLLTEEEKLYCAFYEQVKTAESEAESKAVQCVRDAMPKNWLAAMTWLERKFPDKWARREALDINVTHAMKFQKTLVEALQRPLLVEGESA